MFASELSKPTSICLGAFEGEQLVGYIINSRYVDAWHVMNVAVDPDYRRRGIATRMLEALFELTKNDGRRGYTLEVRVSNAGAIAAYESLGFERRGVRRGYYTDNREDALMMWRETGNRRRIAGRAAWPTSSSGSRPPATRPPRRVVTATARSAPNVVASQAELHARYGGVVPEIASRRHLELVSPVIREALDAGRRKPRRRRHGRRHRRARV